LKHPNLVFVFADQWRAQATGYAGDPNVKTPHLDRLASESVNFKNAVSNCPVCTPARASLLTGQYPLTHGLFLNDVCLEKGGTPIAEVLKKAGYRTAYIGKWHLDGHGRSRYIPSERRQGFDYFKALECTHDYTHSPYYAENDPTKQVWEGYDAAAQTRDAEEYIRGHRGSAPFALFLSWGPPHNPYETAPDAFRRRYEPDRLRLPDNVPAESQAQARKDLAGYYAHCSALDDGIGRLLQTLADNHLAEETLFAFWSDHGDMLGSHGQWRKQRPYDESIRVPLLMRYPVQLARSAGRVYTAPLNTPDLMPTLLGLCGAEIPASVEGRDFSKMLLDGTDDPDYAALIASYAPFGEWPRTKGGREYRGLRTSRHTYVRDLKGPWLLFDNNRDPLQLRNLIGTPEAAEVQPKLEAALTARLKETRDEFRPSEFYIKKWGYCTDKTGTVPYEP
jgi:arylsulfatase A-like enzyme